MTSSKALIFLLAITFASLGLADTDLPPGYTDPICKHQDKDPGLKPSTEHLEVYDNFCSAHCICLDDNLPFVPPGTLLCSNKDSRLASHMRQAFQHCRAGCQCGTTVPGDKPGMLFVSDREYEENWWAYKALQGKDYPGVRDPALPASQVAMVEKNRGYSWVLCTSMSDCGSQALAAAGYAWQCVASSARTLVGLASTAGLIITVCHAAGIDTRIAGQPVQAAISDAYYGTVAALRGGLIPLVTSAWWAIKRKMGRRLPEALGGPRQHRLGGLPGSPGGKGGGRLDGISRLVAGGGPGRKRSVEGGQDSEGDVKEEEEDEDLVRRIQQWDAEERDRIRRGEHVCACNATYISRGCCSAGPDGKVWEGPHEQAHKGAQLLGYDDL
ncbi:MAG: hypothetical protein M1814_002011 [Vezdaea aestivalis]|nr:MAG: hypothetical protein M1814_002011 [Vezdaea aestivalis]